MDAAEYIKDPCGASSLPFWKTEGMRIPDGVAVIRDDMFSPGLFPGRDEPYFKLVRGMRSLPEPALPAPYVLTSCGTEEFTRHINECYDREHVSYEELCAWRQRPVYDAGLWIAVADPSDGRIAASGIAELDSRIGEGILEWIQVSPGHRRRGLGSFLVCELLRRMGDRADFVTVSGRVNEPGACALYTACGFGRPVIWHVVRA